MILSIDIGIRNLALCIMNSIDKTDISTYSLELWDVYNILDSGLNLCKSSLKSNSKTCNKKCSYKYLDDENLEIYCCKTHFPKNKSITSKNKVKIKKINDYLLQDIIKIFLDKFNIIYSDNLFLFQEVNEIYIELQPKINPKMRLISNVLFGKLVELYSATNCKIRFVGAVKKLKAYTGPYIECKLKSKYSQRKWLGVQYCRWFLETKFNEEQKNKWLNILNIKGKTDDMSDTFLMAINAIYGLPKNIKQKK